MKKLLGIDYGKNNIGIALSDDEGRMAFPKEILKNDTQLLDAIVSLVEEEKVSEIIIGESRDHEGKENLIMTDIKRFKKALEEKLSVPVFFELEFLTSVEAKRQPEEADQPRSRKQKVHKRVDASAATLILQSFINKRKM